MARLGKGGGGSCYKVQDKTKIKSPPICLKIIDNSELTGMLEMFK